jgi:hypothetical protein
MTRMICRLPLVASLVLLLSVILSVSATSDAMAASTWSTIGSMTVARFSPTATLLPDGRVLVAGGCSGNLFGDCSVGVVPLDSAELYDPVSGSWSGPGA